MVFRVNPFIPLEIIAKATLSETSFSDILTENHFIRLAYDENYMCKVHEEIIAYSQEKKKILFLVAIIESAENDLMNMCKVWASKEKSEDKVEFFSSEKLEYICLKAI